MKNQTAQNQSRSRSVLKAVVLYGEFQSGIKARELLQRVSHRAGRTDGMESLFWRFDVMTQSAVAREALYRAVDADLVLLVARGMSHPPEWLEEWLEVWAISRRMQDAVLAAWCEGHAVTDDGNGVEALRNLASRHGLEFLCAEDTKPKSSVSRSSESRAAQKPGHSVRCLTN